MRKIFLFISLGVLHFNLFGQLQVKPVPKHLGYASISNGRSTQMAVPTDTIQLPFWDDFSFTSTDPDTTLWQYGKDILVNATLGIAPPTLNVATFDGTNAAGQPHDISEEIVGPTDSLISQPIDLSLVSTDKRNSVFLSFFWQMKGLGEQPDPDDSIRLQFLNVDTVWVTQWSRSGLVENLSDEFQKQYIQVTDPSFFHKGFRMKFQAFGKTTGPFDAWHLDYVYLNQDRTDVNESILDHAIATQPLSLFSTYTSIPYAQLFAFPDTILNPLTFEVATQDTRVAQAVLVFYTVRDLISGHTLLQDLTQNTILPLNIPPDNKNRDVVTTQVNIAQGNLDMNADSLKIEIELSYQSDDGYLVQSIDGGDTTFLVDPAYNFRVNDTLRRTFTINDVLAYDDGIAEFAAGLNAKNGQLVEQYVIAEADSITHLDIYFPQIKPSASGQIIELLVLRDTIDQTGSIQAKQPTTVQFTDSINKFTRYKLEEPIVVRDTFYIGFEQNTNDFVGVGLDKSNPQGNKIFFKTQDFWEQNLKVEGALMMRPIFGKTNTTGSVVASVAPPTNPNEITLFPNPANNEVYINGRFDHAELYSISGQPVATTISGNRIITQGLRNGIYILRTTFGNQHQSHKLIIRH